MQVIDNSTNQETALDSLFTFLLRFIHARLMGVCPINQSGDSIVPYRKYIQRYRFSIARSRMVSFLNPNPSEIWHLISSKKHIFCHFQTSYLPKKLILMNKNNDTMEKLCIQFHDFSIAMTKFVSKCVHTNTLTCKLATLKKILATIGIFIKLWQYNHWRWQNHNHTVLL